MSHTWENDEKPNFGPNFDPFGPNLGSPIFIQFLLPVVVKHYFQLLCYAIQSKTNEQSFRKCQKT